MQTASLFRIILMKEDHIAYVYLGIFMSFQEIGAIKDPPR